MPLFLILHNIRSLHNVGSMFRTADAAGVDKIYLTGYTPSPYDFFGKLRRDFAKTAIGAEKFVPWEQKKSIGVLINELKDTSPPKVFVVSLEQSPHAIPYNKLTTIYHSKLKKYSGVALIVGNEVRGISPTILKKSDAVIEIPIHGLMVRQAHHPKGLKIGKESLNVAVAVGIALFSLREQFGRWRSK